MKFLSKFILKLEQWNTENKEEAFLAGRLS